MSMRLTPRRSGFRFLVQAGSVLRLKAQASMRNWTALSGNTLAANIFSPSPIPHKSIFFLVGILIHVLLRYFLSGSGVPGFPFLASIIAIFSGTQLFALGIIGEYLARMHFRMMDRPSYAIREVVAVPESKGTA